MRPHACSRARQPEPRPVAHDDHCHLALNLLHSQKFVPCRAQEHLIQAPTDRTHGLRRQRLDAGDASGSQGHAPSSRPESQSSSHPRPRLHSAGSVLGIVCPTDTARGAGATHRRTVAMPVQLFSRVLIKRTVFSVVNALHMTQQHTTLCTMKCAALNLKSSFRTHKTADIMS